MNIDRLTDLLVEGTLEKDAYERAVHRALADADAARDELSILEKKPKPPGEPTFDELMREAANWQSALDGADVHAKRRMLAALIKRVVVARERRGVYRVVDMTWTRLGEEMGPLAAGRVSRAV